MTRARSSLPLSALLRDVVEVPASADPAVRGVKFDSREVKPGDLFLAVSGARTDGRDFIAEAVRRGAVAVLYEAGKILSLEFPVVALEVPRLREYAGIVADRFYGQPSRELVVIGVTGTNGKTTCTQLLAQTLDRPPKRCALIGTLGYGFPDALDTSLHTTPDAVTVHRLLRRFADGGAGYVGMEVSSHALDQGRVNGLAFDVAVFTNLTREHLDYHGDMASYGASKAKLFDLPGLAHAIINADDVFGRALIANVGGRLKVASYGIDHGDIRAHSVRPTHDGLRLRVATPVGAIELHSPLFGRFNAYNLLAALASLLALGIGLEDAAERLSQAQPASGRVERFGGRRGAPLVVVDYAHTPDALQKVLMALREHVSGKLCCVFGCGGDRDRGKRPEMGRIAEELADTVVLTDDNPRHESGDAIVADILAGMRRAPRVIRDRRAAIATAVAEAGPDDVVLVAGKGHEDYQQVGDQRLPYSDRATIKKLVGAAA